MTIAPTKSSRWLSQLDGDDKNDDAHIEDWDDTGDNEEEEDGVEIGENYQCSLEEN